MQPQKSFSEIFAEHAVFDKWNETVERLGRSAAVQIKVIQAISDINQSKLIDLVRRPGQARIAMAFYAGDGVILKLSPEDYLPQEQLPFVMPPFWERTIEGTEVTGNFRLQSFPYVEQVSPDSRYEIESLRTLFAQHGITFKKGDDKQDNVGRMPDGTPVVQDGDAVRPTTHAHLIDRRVTDTWLSKVRDTYGALYASGYCHHQSSQTDFNLRAPRIIQEVAGAPSAPKRKGWLSRLMRRS